VTQVTCDELHTTVVVSISVVSMCCSWF